MAERGSKEPMKIGTQKAKNQDQFIEGEKRFDTSKPMLKYQNTVRKKKILSKPTSQKRFKERWRECAIKESMCCDEHWVLYM